MGTNRRKALKDRKKRREIEAKRQAANIAKRLLVPKRKIGIDKASGPDWYSLGQMYCKDCGRIHK